MTTAELAAAKALCASEDLSTWPQQRLYSELYRLHALVPALIAEVERLSPSSPERTAMRNETIHVRHDLEAMLAIQTGEIARIRPVYEAAKEWDSCRDGNNYSRELSERMLSIATKEALAAEATEPANG